MLIILLIAAIGYLVGSLPTGYIAGRIGGVDIRAIGSGNVGATNVTRALGKRFGYPVFFVDFAKGLIAVMIAELIAQRTALSADVVDLSAATAGFSSVIGHSFPVWLGFRGGKGVATSIGVLFGMAWLAAVVVCAVWLIVFQTSRYVSLASIAAAVTLPIAMTIMLLLNQLHTPVFVYFSLCLAVIVVARHRSNLSRLAKGSEPRVARK